MMLSKKDQTDADAAHMLLGLSQSPKMHSAMRQSAINILIQIMHNINHKGEKSHREVRTNAAKALCNIVESTEMTKEEKYELRVLRVLETIRVRCDTIFEFVHSILSEQEVETSERKSLQNTCDIMIQSVGKLYTYSNEKNKCRHAVLALGGVEASAELLVVNFCLMKSQKMANEKPVCLSTDIIKFAISTLVNLTYGDFHTKSILCLFPDLLNALMHHLELKQETIIASGAQLLCNLSWKATADIKDSLLKCGASIVLIEALPHVKHEIAIQNITKALWNLSGHSRENKLHIIRTGLKHLVELLSCNSSLGIVQNVGGILKNLSDVIMQEEEYREIFRQSGGLGKLVQHLKSEDNTVLANATGILLNLSASFPVDQKMLWDLGCVPLLKILCKTHHKTISRYAQSALRNLSAYKSEQTASVGSMRDNVTTLRDRDSKNLSKGEENTMTEQTCKELKRVVSVTETELYQTARKLSSSMIDARRKKTSRGAHRGRLRQSLSQSQSNYPSSTSISDTHSEIASTPSDVSNEPRHAPSLLPYPYDPQNMEVFDPSTLAYEDNDGIVSSGQPPSLPELHRLKVLEKVGANYFTFGIFLLNDQTGSRVRSFKKECQGDPEDVMFRILQEWLEGKGLPVMWESLVQTLRDTGLSVLADQIQASKIAPSNAHSPQSSDTPNSTHYTSSYTHDHYSSFV